MHSYHLTIVVYTVRLVHLPGLVECLHNSCSIHNTSLQVWCGAIGLTLVQGSFLTGIHIGIHVDHFTAPYNDGICNKITLSLFRSDCVKGRVQ